MNSPFPPSRAALRLSRRAVLGGMASAAGLALAGCHKGDRPLFCSDAHPDGYPTVEAVKAMGKMLDERSGGRLRIRMYAGGQLGAEKDTLEITIFGGIDLNRVNIAPLNVIAPETLVASLPFLFESVAHSRRVFDGAPGQKILDSLTPHGLIGLCFYDSGARSFYNTRGPIREPDDLKGLKIRVQSSDLYVQMVAAAGGNPTPVPLGEVYQALVQGVVDGAENNWPSYEEARHYEVARYFSLTRHVMAPEVLVMSRHSWEKLSDADKALVLRCARDSVPIMRELWDARVEESRKRVIAAGVKVNDDVDLPAFKERMRPVWGQFITTPELQRLVEDAQALGDAQTATPAATEPADASANPLANDNQNGIATNEPASSAQGEKNGE